MTPEGEWIEVPHITVTTALGRVHRDLVNLGGL
jgi:hypothetical protein